MSGARPRRTRGAVDRFGPAAVALVAVMVGCWGITAPSYWNDEAATVAAVDRPLSDLFSMAGHYDAVHTLYYVMLHPIAALFGTHELALRLPSAVAVGVAAYGIVILGRRLLSSPAAEVAGLLFALSVPASAMADNARSNGIELAIVVWTTIALLEAIRRPRIWLWSVYALALLVLQLLNVWEAFLLPVHGLVVLQAALQRTGEQAPTGRIRGLVREVVVRRWLVAVAVAETALVPFVKLATGQNGQVGWIKPVTSATPWHLLVDMSAGESAWLAGPHLRAILAVLVAVLLVIGVLAIDRRSRVLLPAWLVIPGASLFALSLVHPYFASRYVFYALPALYLLLGAAVVRLSRMLHGAVAGVAVVALLGLSVTSHLALRTADGHHHELRQAGEFIHANAQPGDGVMYLVTTQRLIAIAYPADFTATDDLTAARPRSWSDSNALAGVDTGRATIAERLVSCHRVWVFGRGVKGPRAEQRLELLARDGFRLERTVLFTGVRIELYVR